MEPAGRSGSRYPWAGLKYEPSPWIAPPKTRLIMATTIPTRLSAGAQGCPHPRDPSPCARERGGWLLPFQTLKADS
jgi:hypothetical protein